MANEEMRTIQKERSNPSFPTREMTYFVDGGKATTEYREMVMQLIERDEELLIKHPFDITRPEARAKCAQQIRRAVELRNSYKNDPTFRNTLTSVMNSYDRSWGMRMYVHDTLFNESIWAQGTEEQYKKWKTDILETKVLGCFSMTELGHSSFLRGVETSATYDKSTQEFIINTPTVTGTKWWIGMAGEIATHTVAICKLIIDGTDHGLHWFIVPLRDPSTGRLLPGVTCGDVGSKMGRNGLDNGWLQFTGVRIPRENLLMKWAKVSPEGVYTPPPNQQVVYATLIGERLLVPEGFFDIVGQAVTISVRYGAVRRQGPRDEQLIDYQSHQYMLMPVLAGVYASRVVFRYTAAYWKETLALQEQGVEGQKEFLKRTPDMHAVTAGLKTWFGWYGTEALESCRRSLGGHGYSSYNAIAGLIGDWGVVTTGGGDNLVLGQQCARYLLSSLQKAGAGKHLSGSVEYMNGITGAARGAKFKASSPSDLLNSEIQLEAYRWLSITMLNEVGAKLQNDISTGLNPEDAWNNNLVQLLESTRAHTFLFTVKHFVLAVQSAPKLLQVALKKLCDLWALYHMHKMSSHFLELSYMTKEQSQMVYSQVIALCKDIRKDAVLLVDSLNYPDWILKAPVGRFDGDIYNHYLKIVKEAPNGTGVPSYYNKHVKPMLTSKL